MTVNTGGRGDGEKTAARIRLILESRSLTLHQVTHLSRDLYESNSQHHIPHTLYHLLGASPHFGLSLAQLCTLSRITRYRIHDWFAAVGLDLERIAGLQATLPTKRTRLLDRDLGEVAFGEFAFVARPEDRKLEHPQARVVPLAQLVRLSPARRPNGKSAGGPNRWVYAKLGHEDAFASPELLAGSIVRVDRRIKATSSADEGAVAPQLLLLEHERGLWCGRFHEFPDHIMQAVPGDLAYAPNSFQIPRQARVIGRVDLEIRWIAHREIPDVPADLATPWQPQPLRREFRNLNGFLQRARTRAGLTLREASLLSERLTQALGDHRYFVAQSTLSDYEGQNVPPRQIRKVFTVCLIYGIRLSEFIEACGISCSSLGQDSIPLEMLNGPKDGPRGPETTEAAGANLPFPLQRYGEVPWFLRHSLAGLSGIPNPSLRDFFWLSEEAPFLPPELRGGVLAMVDRRRKRPLRLRTVPNWMQPAYILLLRSGDFLCVYCSLERDTLVLYPPRSERRSPERLRLGSDAEVVGQVIAAARHVA